MTDGHAGKRRRSALRRFVILIGPSFAAVGGLAATVIQIATLDRFTPAGMVALGFVVAVSLLPVGYQLALNGSDGGPAVVAAELDRTKNALDSTFAGYRPYHDDRTIVFNIGERPDDDTIEEYHVTRAAPGSIVHWFHLEALNREASHKLTWADIKLVLNRQPEPPGEPQAAVEIRLPGNPPRALVLFAPPRDRVQWSASYRSPGYWDLLRRGGLQEFEWIPPAIGLEEESKRRSPVRSLTFVFRVPASLGWLSDPQTQMLPSGVTFERDDAGQHRYTVQDVAGLPGVAGRAAVNPISWSLKLIKREGAT
ncbi:hypothetical protein OHA21_18710 [Actinoplanes sp. NBC_00393]|uniref:hypothetical protein n=1 Tax=Actinoplanes sp. NBC_00393 TaxID=2975953 RepID=UPI002E1DDAC1